MKEDVFIDSGAWSLFRLHVLKTGKKAQRVGKTGRVLEEPDVVVGGQGDFTFYDLRKGAVFRNYCDHFIAFIKEYRPQGIRFFATVDAIGNPDITWEIQRFFEGNGVTPIPVVHFGTPMKYLDRYLERGYEMIGLGGFARRPDRKELLKWCDEAFLRICPKSNKRLPVTKIHGFAMTSWHLIRRWPWYSVDSTSWLLYGTYGLICVPYWSAAKGFHFERPPMIVSVSHIGRPIDFKTRMHISQKHGDTRAVRKATRRWLEYLGLELGSVDEKGEVVVPGVGSSNTIRTSANLRYFMDLEASLPKWPWALDERIVKLHVAEHHRGFGLI